MIKAMQMSGLGIIKIARWLSSGLYSHVDWYECQLFKGDHHPDNGGTTTQKTAIFTAHSHKANHYQCNYMYFVRWHMLCKSLIGAQKKKVGPSFLISLATTKQEFLDEICTTCHSINVLNL
jgi:hypothetical protein